MKITPEDMDDVRAILDMHHRVLPVERDEHRDIALALILVRIYDRGYRDGYTDGQTDAAELVPGPKPVECPYTHAHTRHWCGYSTCRDS